MAKVRIEYLNVGGEERPVLFSNYALYLWSKWTGKGIADLGNMSSMSFADLMDLFRAGLFDGAMQAGQNPKFTDREVCIWFTETPEATMKMMALFSSQVMATVGSVASASGETEPEAKS